jgi:hypothetical protein
VTLSLRDDCEPISPRDDGLGMAAADSKLQKELEQGLL